MIALPLTNIAGHHPMGASTGVSGRGTDWPTLVREACAVSTHAIELAAHDVDELPGLIRYLSRRPRLPFRHVSVHTPVKGALAPDASRVATLLELPLNIRTMIAHPDLVGDPEPYRALGRRLVFENMDDRKSMGRTADELAPLFDALPDAGFCLDIAHAHTVDPTMRVASELLDRFRGRLREVHLSSIRAGSHTCLTKDDEVLFAPLLARCRDVPWILEAPPPPHWTARARLPLRGEVGEPLAA